MQFNDDNKTQLNDKYITGYSTGFSGDVDDEPFFYIEVVINKFAIDKRRVYYNVKKDEDFYDIRNTFLSDAKNLGKSLNQKRNEVQNKK